MKSSSRTLIAALILILSSGCGRGSAEHPSMPGGSNGVSSTTDWSLRDALYSAAAVPSKKETRIEIPLQANVRCWVFVTPTMIRTELLSESGISAEDKEKLISKARSVFERAVMAVVASNGQLGDIQYVPQNVIVDSGTMCVRPGERVIVRRLDNRDVFELVIAK